MEILTWVLIGCGALCFILACGFDKKKGNGKKSLICLLLCGAFIFGGAKMDGMRRARNEQNDKVVMDSEAVQKIIAGLRTTYKPNSYAPDEYKDAYTLSVIPDESLHAQKPYAAILLTVDKESNRAQVKHLIIYSEGSTLSEEGLAACRTFVFMFSDKWATAQYTTGGTSGSRSWGTSERYRCYLYDVETGKLFAEGELKAKELPDKTSKSPHYYVSDKLIRDWIESHMAK